MAPLEAILLGAGSRGTDAFGAFALREPEKLKFVAVADPKEGRRKHFAKLHNIPEDRVFASAEELLAQPRLAPICINATMDRMHVDTGLAAMEKGYHVLLEKPMAVTPQECRLLEKTAIEKGVFMQICHPLRFTPFYLEVKRIMDSGELGDIINIQMHENVGYWHFMHSYVRGNWRNVDTSGPTILTKCCHDMDLAVWLAGCGMKHVSSHGNLRFFRKENAPEGAPDRCIDGCPVGDTCAWNAAKYYLSEVTEWPTSVISVDTSVEAREKALREGPYGRCAFKTDNSAVDHQVVSGEYESGASLGFSVIANSFLPYRTIRVIGTKAELNGNFESNSIVIRPLYMGGWWPEKKDRVIEVQMLDGGHGGGDTGVLREFCRIVRENDMESSRASLRLAVEGHLLSFAAEKARAESEVVHMSSFRKVLDEETSPALA